MVNKTNTYITLIVIALLAFAAGVLVYPRMLNLSYLPHIDFKLGLDLQGGAHLVYQADLRKIADSEKSQAMEGLRDVIERRINLFGVSEPQVQVQGSRLVVELAGIVDPQKAIEEIGKTPFLEFGIQKPNFEEILENNKKAVDEGREQDIEDPFEPTMLDGRYLKRADISFDQNTGQPMVSIEFNEEGAKLFADLTEQNIGKQVAIYLDGTIISAPTVQEKISGGRAQISGRFTVEEAKELARNLNAGALPIPIELISQQSVGPTLGAVSLQKSTKAGMIGFLAVVIFMVIFYRLPGVLSALALFLYMVFTLALYKIIPVTLTLAGIAGFILSVGMAVDANVLIFSRMREEMRAGRNFASAIEEGFNRAWPSIRDGNITTLIVSIILFIFGTSFVKGFGLTLTLGVLLSMVSAVFVTKRLLVLFVDTPLARLNWLWR